MSRTLHHSRHVRQSPWRADPCCDLPGHIDACTAADAVAGAVVSAAVSAHLTTLRPGGPRRPPRTVERSLVIYTYERAWPSHIDERCSQEERAARANVRTQLRTLTVRANSSAGDDLALERDDLAAIAPTRHRRSATARSR